MTGRAAVIYPFPNLLELGWGNSLRASLLIRYLAERCERVDTLSPATGAGEVVEGVVHHRQIASPRWRLHLDRWRLRITRLIAGTDAAFARGVLARFDEPHNLGGFDAALRSVVSHADAVFVEYPFWLPFIAPVCRKAGVPVILSLYDVHAHAHASDPAAASQIASRELDAIRLADVVFCTSDGDRGYLAAHGIEARLAINPIDVASCRAAGSAAVAAFRARHDLGDAPIAMFVGSRIVPNLEAAQAIARLAPTVPDCTFVIAGRCVRAGREGNLVRLGWLSGEDLEALYASAELVVMPLSSGTGTSLKFVEAMAYGKPIVATAIAARGYDAAHGEHVDIVPDVSSIVAGVRRVLDDPAYRSRIASGARSLAPRYDFNVVFEPYGALLRRGRAPSPAGVP